MRCLDEAERQRGEKLCRVDPLREEEPLRLCRAAGAGLFLFLSPLWPPDHSSAAPEMAPFTLHRLPKQDVRRSPLESRRLEGFDHRISVSQGPSGRFVTRSVRIGAEDTVA